MAGWGVGEETVVVVQVLMLGPATCIRLALYWERDILDEGVLREGLGWGLQVAGVGVG